MERGKLDEYSKCTIEDMANKVAAHLAQRHQNVQKGVTSVMGGKILESEAKTIRREGMAQGRREGMAQGRREGMAQGIVQTLASLVRDGVLSIKEAAARGAMTETEFRTQMHTLSLSV